MPKIGESTRIGKSPSGTNKGLTFIMHVKYYLLRCKSENMFHVKHILEIKICFT